MGSGGCDIILSPLAQEYIPLEIEVKRRNRISHIEWMKQATNHGTGIPTVWFRQDGDKQLFVTLKAEDFIEFLKRGK